MAEGSPPRILRTALLDPINDARAMLQRLRSNEMFRRYLRERWLHALPLVAAVVLGGLALSGGTLAFFVRANSLLALTAAILLAPVVLIGSVLVQAYVLLSWLEGRSLAKLQEHRRARERGPFARWVARRFRIDLGPFPRVPWIPALVLFALPAAMLASVAAPTAAGIAVFLTAGAILYARRDPVPGVRGVDAPSRDAADLDFAASAARSGGGRTPGIRSTVQSTSRAARSAVRAGLRGLGLFARLGLLNLLPFVEYCALFSGVFFVVTGRQAGSAQDVALGMALIGAALLLAGLASIVTKRMSFRFYASLRTSYAGGAVLIAGMMLLVAGGLAAAAAQALATHAWQARLDALHANPWPLLIPLALLLIGAGLLLVRRSSDRVGLLGTVLFLLPKTLIGVAVLGAGAAILAGWAWNLYDPPAFRSFVGLVPDEYMNLLANGWNTALALLR